MDSGGRLSSNIDRQLFLDFMLTETFDEDIEETGRSDSNSNHINFYKNFESNVLPGSQKL